MRRTNQPRSAGSRVRAAVVAFALVVPLTVLVAAAVPTAAQAAGQTMTITPAGPYKGGEVVVVKVTGFSPNAPVAIGLCKKGRVATGPGDCAASKTGGSRLIQANAQGVGEGKITIIVGPIGNSKPPLDSCGPKNPCYLGAANITNAKEAVNKPITYVGATSSTPKPTATATQTAEPTSTSDPGLPPTGPREDALRIGLVGALLLQLGLIAAVRAARAGPRGRAGHA